jgi:hypothetical protein
MKRAVYALAVTAVLAVAASASFPRRQVDLWAVVRDGAQEVLSVTFSVSARVLNWLDERCEVS